MRRVLQVGLLGVAAVACLGTSKRLYGKWLVKPQVTSPAGVQLVSSPEAVLGENVNNQGCFAKQFVDFKLSVRIKNDTPGALSTSADWIELLVGYEKSSRKHRVSMAQFLVRRPNTSRVDRRGLSAGETGLLLVRARRIFKKTRLKRVRWVQLTVAFQGLPEKLVIKYTGIHKLKTESVRRFGRPRVRRDAGR